MRLASLLSLCLLTVSTSALAVTDEVKKAADELVLILKEESNPFNQKGDEGDRRQYLKQAITQVQSLLAQGYSRRSDQTLEGMTSYLKSEKSLEALGRLREAFKAEKEAKGREMVAKLEGYLKGIVEKLSQATAPEALDPVLEDLNKNGATDGDYEGDYDQSNPAVAKTLRRLSSARQYVIYWQDYLQARKTGNRQKALEVLSSLSQQSGGLMPRSQLLSLMEQEKGAADEPARILAQIKKLDDIQEALKALSKVQNTSRYYESGGSFSEVISTLGRLEKNYREFLAGLPVQLELFGQSFDSNSGASAGKINLVPLKAEFLLLVLPRTLGMPEGAKPKDGETVLQFMDRVMAEARDRGDGLACERIRQVQQTLSRSGNSADSGGLRDYLSAQNQMEAGQFMLAVVSLQKALGSGSDLVPSKRIGLMLEELQKGHPKEFEQGMAEFLTPRPQFDPGFTAMMNRQNQLMEARTRGSEDPRGPVLTVPAKSPDNPPKKEETKPAEVVKPEPAKEKAPAGK